MSATRCCKGRDNKCRWIASSPSFKTSGARVCSSSSNFQLKVCAVPLAGVQTSGGGGFKGFSVRVTLNQKSHGPTIRRESCWRMCDKANKKQNKKLPVDSNNKNCYHFLQRVNTCRTRQNSMIQFDNIPLRNNNGGIK